AIRAFLVQQFIRLVRLSRPMDQPPRRLAFRICAARQEGSEAAALDHHLLAAFGASLGWMFAVRWKLRREVARVVAIRIAVAAHKKPIAADALQQMPLLALRAKLGRRD